MDTITINIVDITTGTLTNENGVALKIAIDKALKDGHSVVLSFAGIHTISTSFLTLHWVK